MKLVFVLVAILFLLSLWLDRVYRLLPVSELKRRARSGSHADKQIYKVAAHGETVDLFFLILGVASGTYLLVASARYAWWLTLLLIVLFIWLGLWAPRPAAGRGSWKAVAAISPAISKLLGYVEPTLKLLARLLPHSSVQFHTGLYDKQDLLGLLDVQNNQVDSRIDETDLRTAFNALTFADKKVSDTMTPRRDVHFVLANEILGPTLMDELHKTGFKRFPVVKEIKKNIEPEIIGTLLLADITGLDKEGEVAGVMHKGTHYINEASGLSDCLDAFIKTRAHLLVVINNFDEVAGVISLDDVLAKLLPKPLDIDFSDYHDRKSVAGLRSQDQ